MPPPERALWPLDRPLPVDKDPARAVMLLTRLAARLGAGVDATKDLAVSLPLAGAVAPGRTYTVEDLEAALDAGETGRM